MVYLLPWLLLRLVSPLAPVVLNPAAQEALSALARPRLLNEDIGRRLAALGLLMPVGEERAGCSSCPWRYGCAGVCPWLAGKASGRMTSPSPYCPVYHAFFPELLRLEGLHLPEEYAEGPA